MVYYKPQIYKILVGDPKNKFAITEQDGQYKHIRHDCGSFSQCNLLVHIKIFILSTKLLTFLLAYNLCLLQTLYAFLRCSLCYSSLLKKH